MIGASSHWRSFATRVMMHIVRLQENSEGEFLMGQLDKDFETMKILLKESDYAFKIVMESGGVTNSDYADFTSSNFIRNFRHVMQKPDLSRAQLASMLRAAERRRKRRDNDDMWADTMAAMITRGANTNSNEILN